MKLTLDTNCIINHYDSDHVSPTSRSEIAEILEYGKSGRVEIAITTRAESDINQDPDQPRREKFKSILETFSVIPSLGRPDESRWDQDVWADDKSAELVEEIRRIVFPNLTSNHKRFGNKIRDVDHLAAHTIAGRDAFVTDDSRDILKRADQLKGLGILVMSPADCLKFIKETEAG